MKIRLSDWSILVTWRYTALWLALRHTGTLYYSLLTFKVIYLSVVLPKWKCGVPEGRWNVLLGNCVVRGNVSYFKADGSSFMGNGETCKTSLRREEQPIQLEKLIRWPSPFSRKTKKKTSFDKTNKDLQGPMQHYNYLKNYFLSYCFSHVYSVKLIFQDNWIIDSKQWGQIPSIPERQEPRML